MNPIPYPGIAAVWFHPINNFGLDTEQFLKYWEANPSLGGDGRDDQMFESCIKRGGRPYTIEDSLTLLKIMRCMRRASFDVVIVDSQDHGTDPWSYAIHFWSRVLELQLSDEKQLKWCYWLEVWERTGRKSVRHGGQSYISWEWFQVMCDYLWEHYAQKLSYWHEGSRAVVCLEVPSNAKPEWYEAAEADKRFRFYWTSELYQGGDTSWKKIYEFSYPQHYDPEWIAVSGSDVSLPREVRGVDPKFFQREFEYAYDPITGTSPAGKEQNSNSAPAKILVVSSWNDWVVPNHIEPGFDENGCFRNLTLVDATHNYLGRRCNEREMDVEGKRYSYAEQVSKLEQEYAEIKANYDMARIRDVNTATYAPGSISNLVIDIELFPRHLVLRLKDNVREISLANLGSARYPDDIESVVIKKWDKIIGAETAIGTMKPVEANVFQLKCNVQVDVQDRLRGYVTLSPQARKGRTLQFQIVIDKARDCYGLVFNDHFGFKRYAPYRSVTNSLIQQIN